MTNAHRPWRIAMPLALLLPGLSAAAPVEIPVSSSEPTVESMKKFSTDLRTHCLGRYLIDLPVELGSPRLSIALLYFGLDSDFKTVEIQIPGLGDIDRAAFQHRVLARRDKLRTERQEYINASMLIHDETVETPTGPGVLLRFHSRPLGPATSLVSELHMSVDGRYVILMSKSYYPADRIPDDKDIYKKIDPEPTEARLRFVAQYLQKVKDPNRAPPGFCMNQVVVSPIVNYSEERADFGLRVGENSEAELSFKVSMDGQYGYAQSTLQERGSDLMKLAERYPEEATARVVRMRDREVAQMQFQEWAHEIYTVASKTTEYAFGIERIAPEASQKLMSRPAMSISLVSGSEAKGNSSRYSLEVLEAAWDQWLASLRLAPVNGGVPR